MPSVRRHYTDVVSFFRRFERQDLARLGQMVQSLLREQGITFSLLGDEAGLERTLPLDPFPRVIPADEWRTIKRGCAQRVRAMNAFLHDIYHDGRILAAGVVPRALVYTSLQYRREMVGVTPPGGIYIHVAGIDLVRHRDGTYYVLEDNVRVPSGVSYVLENRTILTALGPGLLRSQSVRSVRHYPDLLGRALRSLSNADDPRVVILTPGVFNSAYFEHAFLAREMGIELAEGRDLVVDDDTVYLRTLRDLERVDVIYRRIDDEFLDPVVFQPNSLLGVPGLFQAYRRGRVAIANAIGTGAADDKAICAFIPAMIRFYFNEAPLLSNVTSGRPEDPATIEHLLEMPEAYVLKPADRSGGSGVAILHQAVGRDYVDVTPIRGDVVFTGPAADSASLPPEVAVRLTAIPTSGADADPAAPRGRYGPPRRAIRTSCGGCAVTEPGHARARRGDRGHAPQRRTLTRPAARKTRARSQAPVPSQEMRAERTGPAVTSPRRRCADPRYSTRSGSP